MLLLGLTMDKDVIHHTDHPTQASQNFGHAVLKMLWGAGYPERQSVEAETPKRGDKGCEQGRLRG